ncbi:hypothetical protein F5Y18DRAFT_397437 [Xylariaceae sp. FL1019]|nr:hypothetical protein F5Y18DRAFT_397437 [Xylariaceae sp. FL1019]
MSVVSYPHVGSEVIEACIGEGTDYVDTSGGPAMQLEWINKYHEKAVAAGVIVIIACGVLTAAYDIIAWAATRQLADKHALETGEVIVVGLETPIEISGGTADSIASEYSTRSAEEMKQSLEEPWYLSPKKGIQTSTSASDFGMRRDSHFGLLALSGFLNQNRSVVHRTWGLLNGRVDGFGPNFQYNEFAPASSAFNGFLQWIGGRISNVMTSTPLGIKLIQRLTPSVGEGPDVEKSRTLNMKLEAHAISDIQPGTQQRRSRATFAYPAGPYVVTGVLLAEGAATLLYDRKIEGCLTSGLLTPAALGQGLVDRLRKVGATIEVGDV